MRLECSSQLLGKEIGLSNPVNPNRCKRGDETDSIVVNAAEAVIGSVYVNGREYNTANVVKRLRTMSN
jgi:hypothetical protein